MKNSTFLKVPMIYILHHRFFLILLFLTASGCATLSNPTFEAQVETTHAWSKTHQSTINRTFEIEPISSIQIATSASSSNEINILLSEIISGMERQGFDLASSSAPPSQRGTADGARALARGRSN